MTIHRTAPAVNDLDLSPPGNFDDPTPTVLAGRPAPNWWAVTPGDRHLVDDDRLVTRAEMRAILRRVAQLERALRRRP